MQVNNNSNQKKILFVIDSLVFGGAQRQLVELVKGLTRTCRYEIHLVSLQKCEGFSENIRSLGVNVKYFPRSYKFDLLGPLFRLVCYIKQNKIDLVHGVLNMGSLFGGVAAKLTGCPVVCSPIRNAKDKSRVEKQLKRFLAIVSDIFVSNSHAGFANRFTVMHSYFRVIYNGVDFSRFVDKGKNYSSLKSELGVGGFDYLVGMVGSLSATKDQGTLLSAAPRILEKLPGVGFLFVGDGPKRFALENRAKKLGIDHRVVFAGSRDDVDDLYKLMDVCVLMTAARYVLEGIPNVVVEAMASGIPVVASAGGGTLEVVEHGKTGILVPPYDYLRTADAIIDLLVNQDQARLLAAEARTRVHIKFGLERYIKDYEEIYRELLFDLR